MNRHLFYLLAVLAAGCTDAQCSQVTALGSAGHITCYSGGKVIYEGDSTGKISTEERSDGWYFRERGSDRLIRASGDCIIIN